MKKVLNVIGYISLLFLPIVGLIMLTKLNRNILIVLIGIFILLSVIEIHRYKKHLGISILKVVGSFILCLGIAIGINQIMINNVVGKDIEKIVEKGSTEVFATNVKLDKAEDNFYLFKQSIDIEVYFADGKKENAILKEPGSIIDIKGDYYYIKDRGIYGVPVKEELE